MHTHTHIHTYIRSEAFCVQKRLYREIIMDPLNPIFRSHRYHKTCRSAEGMYDAMQIPPFIGPARARITPISINPISAMRFFSVSCAIARSSNSHDNFRRKAGERVGPRRALRRTGERSLAEAKHANERRATMGDTWS